MNLHVYVDADAIAFTQVEEALGKGVKPRTIHAFFSHAGGAMVQKWLGHAADAHVQLHAPMLGITQDAADHLLLTRLGYDAGRAAFDHALVLTNDNAILQSVLMLRALGIDIRWHKTNAPPAATMSPPAVAAVRPQPVQARPTIQIPPTMLAAIASLADSAGQISISAVGQLLKKEPKLLAGLEKPSTGLRQWLMRDSRIIGGADGNYIRCR